MSDKPRNEWQSAGLGGDQAEKNWNGLDSFVRGTRTCDNDYKCNCQRNWRRLSATWGVIGSDLDWRQGCGVIYTVSCVSQSLPPTTRCFVTQKRRKCPVISTPQTVVGQVFQSQLYWIGCHNWCKAPTRQRIGFDLLRSTQTSVVTAFVAISGRS